MLLQDMLLIVIGRSCSCKVKTHNVLENLKRGIPYENGSEVTFGCIFNPGLFCAFLRCSSVSLPVISKTKAEMKARCNACSLAGFINRCHHLFVSI